MEELNYYFNSDLEDFLSSGREEYKINFNKFNQEFEFFIAILENKPICSNRVYSSDYIDYINDLFNIEFQTSKITKHTQLWCAKIYNLENQKKFNSRFFTQKIANQYNEYQAHEIKSINALEEGYLYKEDFSISGNGNYIFPKDKAKIEKRLRTSSLLKDKIYSRQLDISTLVEENSVFHYENIVDDYFQYRGSIIGKDLSNMSWFKEYELKVNKFLDMNLKIEGSYSIDSFIYDEKVYFMSEINNRKTMGYISKKIKDLYFSQFRYLQTLLVPTRKIKSFGIDMENVYLISPKSNLFGFYIILSNNLDDLKDKELKLYSRVYN